MDSWERPRGGYRRPPLGGDRRPSGPRAPASCAHFLKHRLGTSGWRLFSCLLIGCAAAVIIIIASLLVVFFVNPARKFSEDSSSRSNESRTSPPPPPAIVFGHQRSSSTKSPLHKPKVPVLPTINYQKYKEAVHPKSTSTSSSSPLTNIQDEGQGEAIPVIDTSPTVQKTHATTRGTSATTTTTHFIPLPQQVTQVTEPSTIQNINSEASESPILVTQPLLVDLVEHRTLATLPQIPQDQTNEELMEDITTSFPDFPESETEESAKIAVDNTGWKPLLAKDVVQAWLMHRTIPHISSSTQHSTSLLTESLVEFSTHHSTEHSPEHFTKSPTQSLTEYTTQPISSTEQSTVPTTTQQFTDYSTESSTENITNTSYTEPSIRSTSTDSTTQQLTETSTLQETESSTLGSTGEAISSTAPPITQTTLTTPSPPEYTSAVPEHWPERGRKTNSSPLGIGEVLEVDIGDNEEQPPPTLTVTGGDVRVGDPVEYHAGSSSFWDSGSSEIDAKSVSSDLEARASQTITVLDSSYSQQDGDEAQEPEPVKEHFEAEYWHS